MKTSKQDNEIETDTKLFQLGWYCAQDVMAKFYQNNYSKILSCISGLSLFGTPFEPDERTKALENAIKTSCKTDYELLHLKTRLTPKCTISTNYSYIGVRIFNPALKLILTPSISVFLGQNENERSVITGELETAYTLKYDDFICKGKASYQATTRYGFEDAPYTIFPRNSNYEDIKSFFTKSLRNSIIDVSCELDNNFNELNKELQKKEVPTCQGKEAQVNLTTLLKILTRDNIFEEAIVENE